MKVLVTGGEGFLGSHLVERLLADGHQVLTIDRRSGSRPGSVGEHKNLTKVIGGVDDAPLVNSAFGDFGPDVVVHAAASYRDPDAWLDHIRVNAIGTATIVRAARAQGVERLIYFQTGLSYGTHPRTLPVPLDHPRNADSSYTITKTAGEQYVELSGLDYISLRLSTVYGPRMAGGPLVIFYKRLSEAEPCVVVDARRDFTHVDDLVELVMMAVAGTGHGAYNVGSGSDRPIKDLFDVTVDAMGIELDREVDMRPLPDGDPPTLMLDPAKTTEDFGWRPEITLEEGVPSAIHWYREHEMVGEPFTHLRGFR